MADKSLSYIGSKGRMSRLQITGRKAIQVTKKSINLPVGLQVGSQNSPKIIDCAADWGTTYQDLEASL